MSWLSKLFSAPDKRGAPRLFSPPLIAVYWDGGLSAPHVVPDISPTGVFVRTPDRWSPRTLIRITLRRRPEDRDGAGETITVQCRVVRAAEDGVGMAIMLAEEDKTDYPVALGSLATRKQLNAFLERVRADATGTPIPETPFLPFPSLTPATQPTRPGHPIPNRGPEEAS